MSLSFLLRGKLRFMSQEPCEYFSGVCVEEAVKIVLCSTCDSEVWETSQACYKCLISIMFEKYIYILGTGDSHWHETDLHFFWKEART